MSASDASYPLRGSDLALYDPQSVVLGMAVGSGMLGVAALVTMWRIWMFVLSMLVCGTHAGSRLAWCRFVPPPVHVTAQQRPDEEIIEGALLRQGGGGEYDPRRMIHRVVPIRAEQRATAESGLSKNQNRPPPDAGTRHDPNALVTEREILGQGNQDLAERLQRLAASEQETSANAPVGAGSPDGSVNGTETDPNRAGHGAQAKIRSFLQRELHLLATAPAAAHRAFRLRISISDDGSFIAHGQVLQGSGDDSTDSDLSLQLAQLGENRTAIPELTDEEKAAIAGHNYVVRYVPP